MRSRTIFRVPASPVWVVALALTLGGGAVAQEGDAAIQMAEKLAAEDPDNTKGATLPAFVAALKAVEAKKDAAAVKGWAVRTSALARKTAAAPKAAEESDAAVKDRIDYAKQVDVYTEYADRKSVV